MYLTYDDVLIKPQYSELNSRSEVDIGTDKFFDHMELPVFSANMATVTENAMCEALLKAGGRGILHRFCTTNENVYLYKRTYNETFVNSHGVSVGLGFNELRRARRLLKVGAEVFCLDVAHGAQKQVVEQYVKLKQMGCPFVIVGNFASDTSVLEFWTALRNIGNYEIDALKIGVGPGSACTTRIKTGVGVPQISAIKDIKWQINCPIIADGGIKHPGDVAKALAAGADAVMIGGMFAGTEEAPGEVIVKKEYVDFLVGEVEIGKFKKYSGSAYKENEDGSYCTSEGQSFTVPYKGSVKQILKEIEGGLRSAFTYVGAKNLKEFQEKAELIHVSGNTAYENGAHFDRSFKV